MYGREFLWASVSITRRTSSAAFPRIIPEARKQLGDHAAVAVDRALRYPAMMLFQMAQAVFIDSVPSTFNLSTPVSVPLTGAITNVFSVSSGVIVGVSFDKTFTTPSGNTLTLDLTTAPANFTSVPRLHHSSLCHRPCDFYLCARPNRRCGTTRPNTGGWWSARLVATPSEIA